MSKFKVGFIGCGNMGFALAKAASKVIGGAEIILSAKDLSEAKEKAELISSSFGERSDVLKDAGFIFLAVKPQNLSDVAEEIKDALEKRENKPVIVSMLAGRIVWGAARFALMGLTNTCFSFKLFLSIGFVEALPGIICQIILIPIIVMTFKKANLMPAAKK